MSGSPFEDRKRNPPPPTETNWRLIGVAAVIVAAFIIVIVSC